ncbi:MAG: type II toxin-antitoxin system VapC family toxin [Acidimicrobiales bacterium]
MGREGRAVVDASLVIDFVLGTEGAVSIAERIDGLELWAPAHIDAEVLSAFGRMERAGLLSAEQADLRLRAALRVPVHRELLVDLVPGAWARRPTVRLADALYVELASQLNVPLLTTDARLGRAVPTAEVVTA